MTTRTVWRLDYGEDASEAGATSAPFRVTDAADLERLGERFQGRDSTLISTNLTEAERATLLETFGSG